MRFRWKPARKLNRQEIQYRETERDRERRVIRNRKREMRGDREREKEKRVREIVRKKKIGEK